MTRYADPLRCPDCRAAITPGAASCPVCALSLRGDTAARLFSALTAADTLLAELRTRSVPTATATMGAPVRVPAGSPGGSPTADLPAYPARKPHAAPHLGLSAASVPKILLSLGAVCLLVAALVFLAVTWSLLGVGGRTATLVGFTVVAGALTAWMARRDLRAAAESLGLVTYGLLTLDVLGADHAGWFGDLHEAGLLGLLGAVLATSGVAGTLALRRSTGRGLIGAELVGGLGVALAVVAVDRAAWAPVSWSAVGATLLALAAVAVTHRLRVRVTEIAAAVVAVAAWLWLTGYALDRVAEHSNTWRELFGGGHVVPLLVAAVIAASPALLRRLPRPARVAALAVGELLLAVAVLAPTAAFHVTQLTLVGLGVLVVAAAATWLLPRPWGLSQTGVQAVAALGVLAVAGGLAVAAVERLADAAHPVWAGGLGDLLPFVRLVGDFPMPWLLPLCVVALGVTLWSVAEASPAVDTVASLTFDLRAGAALAAGTLVATLAIYPVPVWLVVALLLAVAAGFTAWWLATSRLTQLVVAAGFTAAALVVSLHADAMTALALVVALALTGLVQLRARSADLAAVAGALLAAALGASVWSWGAVLDAAPEWVALTGLVTLSLVVLGAPYAPSRWWASAATAARTGVEVGAAATALPLALAGVALAPVGQTASWTAVYLTVAGGVVTAMSLLRGDRRAVGWVGGGLLAAASWVRLWDVGVDVPEAYTLPSAAALVVVGLVHLRRNPTASTMTALSPGLSLALVPSLLWALGDPTGLRPVLLGLGCLVLVLAGVALRWTAPIALAGTAGALLVLRLAAPYIGDSVPRWVLIGAAGALLVAVGATWERRLAEARQLVGYVRALR